MPVELTPDQRLTLTRNYSQELADRHGFALDFALHAPRSDPRNFHAHLLATTREIHSTGFGAKTDLEIRDSERLARGLEPFFREVIHARERWAAMANEALGHAKVPVRIDHRSLEAQGIAREPQPRLPRAVVEMERRGQYTELGERVRQEYRERVAALAERSGVVSLEEIRRQAREEWLRMREGPVAEPAASPSPERFFDDDLAR